MTGSQRQVLWLILAVGGLVRLVLAFATVGVEFDIASLTMVAQALRSDPLHVYDTVNSGFRLAGVQAFHWPYPPGFFPWVLASRVATGATGLPFHALVQLPAIACDLGLAALAQHMLGERGAGARARLGGAALVALGPSVLVVSGYHGQIDSVAILPALLAVALWTRPALPRRALVCGVLIGLGASVKTVPVVMVVALLPTVRGAREAAGLIAATVAVPAAALAPFLVADTAAVVRALGYGGAPGLGGLSLVAQPGLAANWLTGGSEGLTAASRALYDHGSALTAAGLVAIGVLLVRRRTPPLEAAVIAWVALYALSPNFFLQYLVWGLPFFVAAGHLRRALELQAFMILPTVLVYGRPWAADGVSAVYAVALIALWIAWVVTLVRLLRRTPAVGSVGGTRALEALRSSRGLPSVVREPR